MSEKNSRREFLIKAAYTAPIVLGIGGLGTPASANGHASVITVSKPLNDKVTVDGTYSYKTNEFTSLEKITTNKNGVVTKEVIYTDAKLDKQSFTKKWFNFFGL